MSNTDRDKQDDDLQFIARYAGSRGGGEIRPTWTDLIPEEAIASANKIEASHIYFREGAKAAQTFLNRRYPEYVIDLRLSTRDGLILENMNTGAAEIAFRGTELKPLNLVDVAQNARLQSRCC